MKKNNPNNVVIDNELYNATSDIWWPTNTNLHLLKTSVNPCRLGYFSRIINKFINPIGKTALEIGCGGGILTEEIYKMGFTTTGIDPSGRSLETAINHAKLNKFIIKYDNGTGEKLPYADNSFDCIFCCDVLEHVADLSKVISEISRVLKPNGFFFYDTLNRTFISKLVAIKILQQWKYWACMPANLHVWKMFIKPNELKILLKKNNLKWQEHRGAKPNMFPIKVLMALRKRVKGVWTYQELGNNFRLVENNNMSIFYMGYAIKS